MASYTRLQSVEDIEPLFAADRGLPVILFKHSLTCPISTAAFREYERYLGSVAPDTVEYTLIEIQNARDVSQAVTDRSGVKHESPQALLVRNGEVVWHASHWDITEKTLIQAVAS